MGSSLRFEAYAVLVRYIKFTLFCISFNIILIYSSQQSLSVFLYVLYISCEGGNNLWLIKRDFEGVILTVSVFGCLLTFISLIRSAMRAASIN